MVYPMPFHLFSARLLWAGGVLEIDYILLGALSLVDHHLALLERCF